MLCQKFCFEIPSLLIVFDLIIAIFLYFYFLSTGSFFSRIFAGLFGSKETRILILGLDGAGKTTILYRYKSAFSRFSEHSVLLRLIKVTEN